MSIVQHDTVSATPYLHCALRASSASIRSCMAHQYLAHKKLMMLRPTSNERISKRNSHVGYAGRQGAKLLGGGVTVRASLCGQSQNWPKPEIQHSLISSPHAIQINKDTETGTAPVISYHTSPTPKSCFLGMIYFSYTILKQRYLSRQGTSYSQYT